MSVPTSIENLDPKSFIIIKGARVNNLKNLSVAIPRNKFVVVTGLSGSGKSSLAFDTLFAEGQRMYVESLSSYARQFLDRLEKPEVDYIKGISPAIAIEQRVNTRNPRSTVGTTTEIYDYLKLLYARIGRTISPVSGKEVKRHTVAHVVKDIFSQKEGTKISILCPLIVREGRSLQEEVNILLQKGFTRVLIDNEIQFIEELELPEKGLPIIDVLIDRYVVRFEDGTKPIEEDEFRLADSVQTAFFEGEGQAFVLMNDDKRAYSDKFELDGILFEEPSVNFFSFNNPFGACRTCEGFGKILGIDPDLVVPDTSASVFEGAIAPWRSETMSTWLQPLLDNSHTYDFPIHRPFSDLSEKDVDFLWKGKGAFKGLDAFFKFIESKGHKIQYRVMLSRYRGRTTCPDCRGTKLRKDASYVKIVDTALTDLLLMPSHKLLTFFSELTLSEHENKVAQRLLKEINTRLVFINKLGLGYLSLNRLTASLSGGEFQRLRLATSLGSALVGSMYILDEPSIGLHPRDTSRLIEMLLYLRNLGNTVIVVEHEEDIMRAADQIIDIGPDSGAHGGELVFQGTMKELEENGESITHTMRYLRGEERIELPKQRRKWRDKIVVKGARQHNLKNITVTFPLNALTLVTGVSGSGKSTLIRDILFPALNRHLGHSFNEMGKFDGLEGDLKSLTHVEFIDQNPIGKSSRSNPVTYVKAYDLIRQLFAEQPLAKQRGYKPAHFSFNVDGGRCETCQGEGVVRIEMQFMADLQLTCESCKGKRFKGEVLEIQYNDKNIADVLDLTIEESLSFFEGNKTLLERLKPLNEVGLGYIRLGQSSSSLSGGEAQRVKLAFYLSKGEGKTHTLFIFDEPTTGLHFHDIKRLLDAINRLIAQNNSVIMIEHNMEVIKAADWVIDLGPEGGEDGGQLCYEGTPENMKGLTNNYTAQYLTPKLGD